MRRFEFSEGGSSKFWEISRTGSAFTVRYGRLGAKGRSQTKDFADAAQATAAAEALIREKLAKGYTEVEATEVEATQAKPASAKQAKQPRAKASAQTGKAGKPTAPALLLGGKSLGARALSNAANRFLEAETTDAWQEACDKVSYSDSDISRLLAHLIEHRLFAPRSRLHLRVCARALMLTPPETTLRVLSLVEEPWVETLRRDTPVIRQCISPLVRLQRAVPTALREAQLSPTLARAAAMVRSLAGESLAAEAGARAVSMIAELLPYGIEQIGWLDAEGEPTPLEPERLLAALERIGGPHWIREFPNPDRLPAEVAAPALRAESLEEVGRALSIFNPRILDARDEPTARFFEVAETLDEQRAAMLRVAGIRKATNPAEVPLGGEALLSPSHIDGDVGFGKLGPARLDAWAARWLERYPEALTIDEPGGDASDEALEAYDVGVSLRRLVFAGVPFGDALRERLIGLPRPYEEGAKELDIGGFYQNIGSIGPEGARALLPLLSGMVRAQDDEQCARGLRLVLARAVGALSAEEEIPEEIDESLSLGDPVDYDTQRALREALRALPVERAERVVSRTANQLEDPFQELTFARAGASELAMRRMARLIASGRENEDMWMHLESQSLEVLGPDFGSLLAEALSGETLSDSFLDRISHLLHPGAFERLEQVGRQGSLDLRAELDSLVHELGGERTRVYALSAGGEGDKLSRVGGLPAGFTPGEVPRVRGRRLVHAITVDLEAVPELGSRYPGARTLSVWVQGYTESPTRAQALITRTEEQIAAAPSAGGTELELLALEVPAAIFEADPQGRAGYARQLLYARPGFLLGGPLWLQTGEPGLNPEFIAQYDERLAPGANFGDAGICYAFSDHCEWQCH